MNADIARSFKYTVIFSPLSNAQQIALKIQKYSLTYSYSNLRSKIP